MNMYRIFHSLFFSIVTFNKPYKKAVQSSGLSTSRDLFAGLPLAVPAFLIMGFSAASVQAQQPTQQALPSLESIKSEREKLAEKVKMVEAMLKELRTEQEKINSIETMLQELKAEQAKFDERLNIGEEKQEEFAERLDQKKIDIAELKEEQERQQHEWETAFDEIRRDPRNKLEGTGADAGWIDVPGYNTAIRFGGFVQLDGIHDFQGSGSNFGAFSPSKISVPTDRKSNTEFDPRTTRMIFETRTNTALGRYSTFLSADWFGSSSNADRPRLRLRQVYMTGVGLLPGTAFTFGQANSTFMNINAWPEVLDNAGPSSFIFVQQGLFRLSKELDDAHRWIASVAVEQPDNKISNGSGKSQLPDAVARIDLNDKWGHLMGAFAARQVKVSATSNTDADSALGWGLNFSGKLLVPTIKDNFKFQVNGGKGIGRYIDPIGIDAVYNAAAQRLELPRVLGAYGAYQHWWTDKIRSTFMGSYTRFFNRTIESPEALKSVLHASANLIYSPIRPLDVGVEYIWGQREDKDGQTGHANRIMFSAKWSIN